MVHHKDFLIGEEVTAYFPSEALHVHVLVWGIDEQQHAEIGELRFNVFELVEYLRGHGIAHGLTHPFAGAVKTLLDPPAPRSAGVAPLVYVPAYEGGHPDHDAVNLAVAVLRSRRPELAAREFPLYRRGRAGLSVQAPQPAAGTAPEPFEVLPLSDDALALRRRLVRANASQALPSLLPLLALARASGRGRAEPSRPLPAHDYASPPHSGALLYELYTRRRFAEFRAGAAVKAIVTDRAAGTPPPPSAPSSR